MKKHRTMIMIPAICLSLCTYGTVRTYAQESVSGDSIVSDSVSEDTVSEDVIEEISRIEITSDGISEDNGAAVIKVYVESTGSDIRQVEAYNAAAGVKKILFHADEGGEDKALLLTLRTGSNGKYVFFACDTKGNTDSCEVSVEGLGRRDFGAYKERAEENSRADLGASLTAEGPAYSVIYGSRLNTGDRSSAGGRDYSVMSGTGREDAEDDTDRYGGWSMLKEKEKKGDTRVWYEPCTGDENDDASVNGDDDLPDLSDYGVKLFRTAVISPPSTVSGRQDDPSKEADTGMVDLTPVDNEKRGHAVVWITLSVFSVLILAAFAVLAFRTRITHIKAGRSGQ